MMNADLGDFTGTAAELDAALEQQRLAHRAPADSATNPADSTELRAGEKAIIQVLDGAFLTSDVPGY